MDLLAFALVVIGVSASGVLAPGPLFAANVSYGLRRGTRAGLKMAVGHAAVELPLLVLLGAGAFTLVGLSPHFGSAVSILGAAALFAFAGLQVRAALRGGGARAGSGKGPLIAGAALTALNPFFMVWWLTVGLKLVADAVLAWALAGALIVFALHVWMDFAWMGAVAFLASRGSRVLSPRNYKVVMVCLSGVLVYFGVAFLLGPDLGAWDPWAGF